MLKLGIILGGIVGAMLLGVLFTCLKIGKQADIDMDIDFK